MKLILASHMMSTEERIQKTIYEHTWILIIVTRNTIFQVFVLYVDTL